jgi:hypothetical protein
MVLPTGRQVAAAAAQKRQREISEHKSRKARIASAPARRTWERDGPEAGHNAPGQGRHAQHDSYQKT